jgi:hypothetical protein
MENLRSSLSRRCWKTAQRVRHEYSKTERRPHLPCFSEFRRLLLTRLSLQATLGSVLLMIPSGGTLHAHGQVGTSKGAIPDEIVVTGHRLPQGVIAERSLNEEDI